MIKAKVFKIKNISNKDEINMQVKTGDIFSGQFENWPEVGMSFYLFNDLGFPELRTTPITELISDKEFRTLNSIYRIVTKEDERDERIKLILK